MRNNMMCKISHTCVTPGGMASRPPWVERQRNASDATLPITLSETRAGPAAEGSRPTRFRSSRSAGSSLDAHLMPPEPLRPSWAAPSPSSVKTTSGCEPCSIWLALEP